MELSEGLLAKARAYQAKQDKERLSRVKANPLAAKKFARRKKFLRSTKAAAGVGAAMGALAGATATPYNPAKGGAIGAVLGGAASAGEKHFYKHGPKKVQKWHRKWTRNTAARAADPKKLFNKAQYGLQRKFGKKKEESVLTDDSRAFLIEALAKALV